MPVAIAQNAGFEVRPIVGVTIPQCAPLAPNGQSAADDSIPERYRLVGTSVNFSDDKLSTAIIEAKPSGLQKRYRNGDYLEDRVVVDSIKTTEVELATPRGVVILSTGAKRNHGKSSSSTSMDGSPSISAANRFGGSLIRTNEWEFSRSKMMDYYNELLARPERLVKVFDSLEPVYNDSKAITGYRFNLCGEPDFFNAVGLVQDDIVRSVNGIPMTNRMKAENLIRRFAANDLDFVVMEIERGGEVVKQMYYIDE